MHLTCEIRTIEGTTLGVLLLEPKTFKSGKTGYFGQAKLTLGSQRYQAQAQLVGIESKPKSDVGDSGDVEAGTTEVEG